LRRPFHLETEQNEQFFEQCNPNFLLPDFSNYWIRFNQIIGGLACTQERRQKHFQGGNEKKPKNSTINPFSTLSVSRMEIHGATTPLPPSVDAHACTVH